jgi:methyl-accepting chemotaxis protein
MFRPSTWKLHTRLLIPTLLVGALILLALSLTGYLTTREALIDQARLTAASLAGRSALEIDEVFTTFSIVPELIAAYEARPLAGQERLAALEATLPLILKRYPTLHNTYAYFDRQVIPGRDYAEVWYTRDGAGVTPFHSNLPGNPNYDPAQPLFDYYGEGWWKQAIDATGTSWTPPYVDPASKTALVSATAPISADGRFIGVAGADLSLTKVQQLVSAIRPTPQSYALLVTQDGTFVANPVWPESVMEQTVDELAGQIASPDLAVLGAALRGERQGLLELRDPRSGALAWVAYHPVESTGWTIAVIVPQPDLLASVGLLQSRFVLLGCGGLILLAFLAYLLARSIARPVRQLASATERMTGGDLSTRVVFSRTDEIGVLAQRFNTMAEALSGRVVAEEQARAEAQRLQQVEAESRQLLEQTVAHYLQFVQRVARGDLTQRLSMRENGALGQLGQELNGMVESLHRITREVQQANSSIAAAAAEILAATTQQAASAAEQSAAITQTSTTIEEVKAIALQTAQQSQQVAQESQTALDVARQGTQAVEDTVASMTQIRDRVANIAQTILSLAEQTQAISAITNTVTDLADQSNLLALNAAIEAARAGEQGKSFAVVAQHVRELAERSKAATAQVSEILRDIQQATNAAVLVTEDGSKGVESGAQLAGQAGQANVQMAAAAQQQTVGMEQIGQAMGSIQQATTQALASTRQAERAAQDLHSLSQSLQQAVAIYKL